MNQKQAIALAIGIILAVAIVMSPSAHTPLHHVSTRTLPNGEIEETYLDHAVPWKPVAYVIIVALAGCVVYRLRAPKV